MNLETLTVRDLEEAAPLGEALAAGVGGVPVLLQAHALLDEPGDGIAGGIAVFFY